MLEWIDSQDQRPPQNEPLLWLLCLPGLLNGATIWMPGGVSEGVYRFGVVETMGGKFTLPKKDSDSKRVFWTRFNLPEEVLYARSSDS